MRRKSDSSIVSFRCIFANQLVTHISKQAVTVAETRRLNAAGSEMTVAVTLIVQHGYSGPTIAPGARNPPNTATGTNVFLKAR